MFCPNCGTKVEDGLVECPKCKKALAVPGEPQVRYGGFWRRFLAYVIDYILVGIGSYLVALVFGLLFGVPTVGLIAGAGVEESTAEAVGVGVFLLIYNIVAIFAYWLYFALYESSSKQATIGKMALGLKVTDLNGRRVSFARASGRYWAKIVSALVFFIGFFMAGFTRKKQALHDIMAGTLVLKTK